MSEIQVGAVLAGRYRIEAKLGEGGMGVVYRAFDLQRQVPVAIKAMKADYAEDIAFVRRFRREAHNLERLNHPNIVRFYEFYDDRLLAFMVLDFIDGTTLRAMMRQRGHPLTPGEALGYLRSIAAVLSYAHHEGVVHCDMKPANVMIDRYGKVFVSDFGIARLSESATMTYSTPGTPVYMAPEQWRGGEEVYPTTDVYALGVMLYEMLTGQVPFTGERAQTRGHTREKIMWEHLHVEPPLASALNPHLPKAFDQVLLRCLAKTAIERYQGAQELLEAFHAVCQQVGIVEAPVQPPSPELVPAGVTTSAALPSQLSNGRVQPIARGQTTGGVGAAAAVLGGTGALVVIGGTVLVVILVLFLALGPLPGRNETTPMAAGSAAALPGEGSDQNSAEASFIQLTDTPVVITVVQEVTVAPKPTDIPVTTAASQIAFVSDHDGQDSIYTMNADGSNRTRITAPGGADQDWWPTWCSHGSEIIFERGDHQRGSLSQRLYSVSVSRPFSEQRWPYAPRESLMDGHPVCDRSSSYVSFASLAAGENYFKIWLADVRSGGSYLFGDGFQRAGTLDVSPNGRAAVLSSYGADGWKVYSTDVGDPYGAAEIEFSGITQPNFPMWSPDGTQIAFSCRVGGAGALCVSDLRGYDLRVIVPDTRIDENRTDVKINAPTWSPDGAWIAYGSNLDGDWDIYIIRPDGTGNQNITNDWTSHEFQPSWKP